MPFCAKCCRHASRGRRRPASSPGVFPTVQEGRCLRTATRIMGSEATLCVRPELRARTTLNLCPRPPVKTPLVGVDLTVSRLFPCDKEAKGLQFWRRASRNPRYQPHPAPILIAIGPHASLKLLRAHGALQLAEQLRLSTAYHIPAQRKGLEGTKITPLKSIHFLPEFMQKIGGDHGGQFSFLSGHQSLRPLQSERDRHMPLRRVNGHSAATQARNDVHSVVSIPRGKTNRNAQRVCEFGVFEQRNLVPVSAVRKIPFSNRLILHSAVFHWTV